VPRPSCLLAAGVAALLIAGPLAGCGGSDDSGDAKQAPRSAEVPPPRLGNTDRKAYARILRSSGALRAAAVPVAYGAAPRIATDQLNPAIGKLAATHPRNPSLRRLRLSILSALRAAVSGGAQGESAKAIATQAIAEADRTDAGLRRYAASHPAANEIAPG
jgi:hypothetical protein